MVIPEGQDKVIQSLDGGIVAAIPVKEGDVVKKNQIVFRLDDTRYKSDFEQEDMQNVRVTRCYFSPKS